MLCQALPTLLLLITALTFVNVSAQEVFISEVMFDPRSNDDWMEYIEIHNAGTSTVSLAGWNISGGCCLSCLSKLAPFTILDFLTSFRCRIPISCERFHQRWCLCSYCQRPSHVAKVLSVEEIITQVGSITLLPCLWALTLEPSTTKEKRYLLSTPQQRQPSCTFHISSSRSLARHEVRYDINPPWSSLAADMGASLELACYVKPTMDYHWVAGPVPRESLGLFGAKLYQKMVIPTWNMEARLVNLLNGRLA